jgi:enoyl-CoA hydratase/carnithine racemase
VDVAARALDRDRDAHPEHIERRAPGLESGAADWLDARFVPTSESNREADAVDYQCILYETRDDVALITLNRPERLNAWTPRMAQEQADAIERANADRAVGAIVMTGAGRGFCAGADMQETFQTRLDGQDPGDDTAAGEGGMPARLDWVSLLRASKPIVAAVNGAAVGVGMTMILPCDVIVASEHAKFGMLFIRMGLVPELASTHFLVQRVGFGRASELCLSGRLVPAQEAFECGLADRLVASDHLLETAFGIARAMGANPPPQLRMIKDLLTRNGSEGDLREVQRRETHFLRECWKTPEHAEAVKAFTEKRSPKFR